MAHYLVSASPREERLPDLRQHLSRNELTGLRPFGKALTYSLRRARRLPNGKAIDQLSVESVVQGSGWALIEALPAMFPELAGR